MSAMRAIRAFVAVALAGMCLVAPAHAAPADGVVAGGGTDFDVTSLSDRYDSLNALGNSLTDEEGVVIATRIGVLTSANRALNDSDVSFDGEVVDEVVNADEGHKWLNVMGQTNTVISVYAPDSVAQLVQNTGGYHATGTSLKITGTYHIACPEHQGELDVHAQSAQVLDAGGPVSHLVLPNRMWSAFVLCGMAFVLLVVFLLARRRIMRKAEA